MDVFPLRSGTKWACLLLSLLYTVQEAPARVIKQERELKGMQTAKKEVKSPLFVDDMILYVRNPKESTKKLLEEISKFSKFSR